MIQFFHVGKRFPGGQAALDDVTFSLLAGQFAFLTGASGAGKTTLLRLIYRGDVPTTGRILVNGRNVASLPRAKIPYLRRTLGVVFQNFRLIDRKTVFENVSYLPRVLGADRESQRRSALWALQRVGLAHRMSAFPQELSGGEQQRVAIARAVIARPDVLVADEPTGNLDPDLSAEIVRLFLEIHRQGTTVLLATHDRSMIERVGGRVLTLDAGRLVRDEEIRGTAPPEPASPDDAGPAAGRHGATATGIDSRSPEPAEEPSP
ncbi:MAG TPA: cell division ATP-binding protein FtsE [Thermoanaerobaculia bacterium]|nr:cell division ATP-binding protein FtsE [Thermoanaerobaculia bacterium]